MPRSSLVPLYNVREPLVCLGERQTQACSLRPRSKPRVYEGDTHRYDKSQWPWQTVMYKTEPHGGLKTVEPTE